MVKLSFILKALAVALSISAPAMAGDGEQLPAIVVDAQPMAGFDQSSNTSHLGREDLLRSGQRELTQVLRATPGLAIYQGMKGGASGLSLRGASAGMGLVTIDGIPLYETLPGGISLDLFPAETFGSADIVRGSAAMLNFGRSLGGGINLHSRDSRETGAGRDDLFDGSHWSDSRQGNGERDDFHAHQLALHLRDRFSERFKIDSSVYYVNSDSGVDKIGLIRPTPEFAIVDDPGRLKQEIWLAQSTAAIDLHPQWHSELQLGFTEHRVNAVIGDVLPGSAPYLIGFDNRLSLARWKNSHRFWLDAQQKRGLQFNWGGEGLYEQGRSLSTHFTGQRGTGGGFANLQGDWDDWQATLAVRADHFDGYGSHAVYHAGLSWQMTTHWQLFANGGTGYRAPSFNEMLMWPMANSQLKPEQSVGGESGLRWQAGDDTQWSVSYFHNRYEGLIKVERSAVPLGLYLVDNIPHAQVQGLETQWSTRWNRQLATGIDYTWTDAENTDTGKPLPRQPQHIARFWGEWAWQTLPLKLWTQGIYRGESFDTGGSAAIGDSFHLDMQLSYQVSSPLGLYLRGENLTDNRQPQVIGWGMPGAAVYGGFRWTLSR